MSKEKKQLEKYQKNYREAKMSQYNNKIKIFNYSFIVYAVIQLYNIISITFMLTKHTDGDKSLIIMINIHYQAFIVIKILFSF